MAFNAEKYKSEWDKFSATFKNPPKETHPGGKLPNRFVEACRASPYIAGHLLMVVLAVLILVIVL